MGKKDDEQTWVEEQASEPFIGVDPEYRHYASVGGKPILSEDEDERALQEAAVESQPRVERSGDVPGVAPATLGGARAAVHRGDEQAGYLKGVEGDELDKRLAEANAAAVGAEPQEKPASAHPAPTAHRKTPSK